MARAGAASGGASHLAGVFERALCWLPYIGFPTSRVLRCAARQHAYHPSWPDRRARAHGRRPAARSMSPTRGARPGAAGDPADDQGQGGGGERMNEWYSAPDSPELAEFGPARGLGVSGVGAPGGPEHLAAIQALSAVAARLLGDRVPALEGRWWVEDDRPPLAVPRARWRWHLFVRLPESVEPAAVEAARQATRLPTAARVQVVMFAEGSCVQAMHHGSYDQEPKTLARIDRFMQERGLVANGLHHELYLSDV